MPKLINEMEMGCIGWLLSLILNLGWHLGILVFGDDFVNVFQLLNFGDKRSALGKIVYY